MENKEIYNEVYGWMPKNLVNKLPNEVRLRLITMWLNRHATDTGWFIVANILFNFVQDYFKQKGEIPFVDVSSLMPGGEEKESQPRDSKGRFAKKE